LGDLESRLIRLSPRRKIEDARQQLDELQGRAAGAIRQALAIRRAQVEGLSRTLDVVSPMAILDRGYALVTRDRDGALVRSVGQVQAGDGLHIRVSDGEFPAVAGEPEGREQRREAADDGG
jgi:exodeoxyribonuclease VII large subunit